MRSGFGDIRTLVCRGCLCFVVWMLIFEPACGQVPQPVLADGNTHAPSPLSTVELDPSLPHYVSKTIHPNQFVTHEIELGDVLKAYSLDNHCTMNEAFDALAKRLQIIPRDFVDQNQPTPGTTTLRRPDAINTGPQSKQLRNAIYQVVRKDVYSITARQVFFNELPINLAQFRFGDRQIVIEVRYVSVLAKDVTKLQPFMIPNSFESYGNQLPQIKPIATHATNKSAEITSAGDTRVRETFVSSSETRTRAFPTFVGQLDPKGFQQLVDFCKGRAETDLVQAPTLTVFAGSRGLVSDAALRPFVVSVKPVDLGSSVEYQPIIQTVEEGVKVALQADEIDGKVQVSGDLFFSKVLGVETFEYPFSAKKDGSKVMIQIPEHQVRRVHWSTSIQSGNTLLIDPVETFEKQIKPKTRFKKAVHESMRKLIMVTPRLVEESR